MKYFWTLLLSLNFCYAATINSPAVDLVNHLTHNQYNVINTFKAINGWTGVVLQSKSTKVGSIVYVDQKVKYVFDGTLIDANGNNLTQAYSQKYLMTVVLQELSQEIVQSHWIAQGDDKAPHKLYVFFDPNCIYCHEFYKNVQHDIDSGLLQVRWIPVGFVKSDSAGKAAKILSASSPDQALQLLDQDEAFFNYLTEEGSIAPLDRSNNDSVTQKAFKQVDQNNQLFIRYGFAGTPTSFYKDQNANPVLVPGYISGAELDKAINAAGAW